MINWKEFYDSQKHIHKIKKHIKEKKRGTGRTCMDVPRIQAQDKRVRHGDGSFLSC
jgi:hypothetical protein